MHPGWLRAMVEAGREGHLVGGPLERETRFRTGLRETWAQAVDYGCEEARVAKQYGAPGRQWWWFPVHVGVSLGTAPVWPWSWSRRRLGQWVWITGNLVGRIRGSITYRTLYW